MTRQAYISFIFSQFSHHAASFFAPTVLSSLGGPCYFISKRRLVTFSGVETATWHGFFAPAPHSKALEKLHTLTIGQKMVFPYVRDRMKLSSMEFFSVKIGIGRLVLISRTTFFLTPIHQFYAQMRYSARSERRSHSLFTPLLHSFAESFINASLFKSIDALPDDVSTPAVLLDYGSL